MFNLIVFLIIYLPILFSFFALENLGLRKPFLIDYLNFEDYFSFKPVFLEIIFLIAFSMIAIGFGIFVCRKLKIILPLSFNFGIGLVIINIFLLPLFFLNLFQPFLLLIFFLIITLVASREIIKYFNFRNKINLNFKNLFIFIIALPAIAVYFLNAISPVSYFESSGDIANTYLNLSMSFAKSAGQLHSPLLAGTIAQFPNFELFTAALISLTNPDIVKLFGFLLFIMVFLLIIDFNRLFLKSKFYFLTSFLFLINPFIINPGTFSLAHPRVYILLLSTLSVFLIFLGRKKRQINYYFLALLTSGILLITNYLGLFLVFLNLLFIIFDYQLVLKYKNKVLPIFMLSLLPIIIFSSWIFNNQGSPLPKSPGFNKVFDLNVDPDMSNNWVVERVALQSRIESFINPINVSSNLFDFLSKSFSWLLIILLIGIFFTKKKTYYFFLLYFFLYIFNLFLIFPKASQDGGLMRFMVIGLPFLMVGLNILIDELYFKIKNIFSKLDFKNTNVNFIYLLAIFFTRVLFLRLLIFLFQFPILQNFYRLTYYSSWIFLILITFVFSLVEKIINMEIKFLRPSFSYKNFTKNFVFLGIIFLLISQRHLIENLFFFRIFLKNGFGRFHWLFLLGVFYYIDYKFNFYSFKNQKISHKKVLYFSSSIIAGFLPILIIFQSQILISRSSWKFISRKEFFSTQMNYLAKKFDFGHYLGTRETKINNFFNTNFQKNEKILFFFHAQGIYTKPFLVQANSVALTSIIYRSDDSQLIMKKLKSNGIKYLCVDNKWLNINNNPSGAMVADLNSIIFTPIFMSTHFVPVESGIKEFYFFRIDYEGLLKEQELKNNFNKINQSGFFRLIYRSLLLDNDKILEIKSGVNNLEKLQREFQEIENRIYPYPIEPFESS